MFSVMPKQVERARESQQRVNPMDVAQSLVKQRLHSSFNPPCTTDTSERRKPICLFCGDIKGDFHKAETLPFDARVRDRATDLRDITLLVSLSAGDIVVIESVYHKNCLNSF